MARAPKRHSTLGQIREKDHHFRARYTHDGLNHTPGRTFSTFALADGWLRDEQRLIDRGEWTPPAVRRAQAQAEEQRDKLTLGAYAEKWVANRQVRGRAIKPRTAEHYRALLASPTWLGSLTALPLVDIDRATVSSWYRKLPDKATMRQHSYALLRSVLATAVDDGIVATNPVNIHGATSHARPREVELLTAEQVAELADNMPLKHRMLVLLSAWCGLRFGELCALRRSDLDMTPTGATIHVRRAVVTVNRKRIEGSPKSDAGVRDLVVPPHLLGDLKAHLNTHAQWGRDGLLFPPTSGTQDFLTSGAFYGHLAKVAPDGRVTEPASGYYAARHAIGRDDLNFHRLRHFAATSLAVAGATDKELLTALGHSSLTVAARYQHAAHSRMESLAAKLSVLAEAEDGAS